MTPSLVAEKLIQIEAGVTDLDWRRSGVNVWPLYRCYLLVRLFQLLVGASPEKSAPRLLDLLGEDMPPPNEGSCTVILNDGFSIQDIGGHTIDRLCTPLCMGLDRLGIANVLLDQGGGSQPSLAKRIGRIGPLVTRAKVKAMSLAALRADPWVKHRCDRLRAAACEAGLDPSVIPSARAMLAREIAVFSLARTFETALKKLNADRVFQVSYYSVAGHAMNLAARRAKIPVIDVQHGVISPLHLAYAAWSLGAEDQHLMPTGHWTWGEGEAEVVRHGRNLEPDAVAAAGHPLVGAWRSGWLPGVEEARSAARNLRRDNRARLHALVSLQPGLMTPDELRPVLSAMRDNADVFWWFRLHPASQGDIPLMIALLKSTGAAYDIDAATKLPLYAVLENVDVNLTHSSTTAVEASAFGVPSVLWSAYGAELFDTLVASREAFVSLTGEALTARLGTVNPRRPGEDASAGRQLLAGLTTFTK